MFIVTQSGNLVNLSLCFEVKIEIIKEDDNPSSAEKFANIIAQMPAPSSSGSFQITNNKLLAKYPTSMEAFEELAEIANAIREEVPLYNIPVKE